MRPLTGFLLALLLTAASLRLHEGPAALDVQAADSWVYSAMAEHPTVFSARPWGYRVVAPFLAHLFPDARTGFVWVSLSSLVLTGGLLFLFLRRLGNGSWPALAAVAAFGLSAPVAESTRNPFLCEPMAALALTAFVLAVESAAGPGVLAVLAVLAALTKETLLVLLPLAYLARRPFLSRGRAFASAFAAALPALAVTLLMRTAWTPQFRAGYPLPDPSFAADALRRLAASWQETGLLLGGLLPLAVVGAAMPSSRPYVKRYGYVALAFLVLPFVAWAYDVRPGRQPFSGATVRRLLIYTLPFALPLVLQALQRVAAHFHEPAPPVTARSRTFEGCAFAAAALLASVPLWALDPYRRIEIRPPVSGPVVRTLCLESLRAAERLDGGGSVVYDPAEQRPEGLGPRLSGIRWFLRDGFGEFPYLEAGELTADDARSTLLLSVLQPADLDLEVSLSARQAETVGVDVNGSEIARVVVGPEAVTQRLKVPSRTLFRGDNLLGLTASRPGLEIVRVAFARAR